MKIQELFGSACFCLWRHSVRHLRLHYYSRFAKTAQSKRLGKLHLPLLWPILTVHSCDIRGTGSSRIGLRVKTREKELGFMGMASYVTSSCASDGFFLSTSGCPLTTGESLRVFQWQSSSSGSRRMRWHWEDAGHNVSGWFKGDPCYDRRLDLVRCELRWILLRKIM